MFQIKKLHRLARLSSVSALLFYSALAPAQSPTPRIRRPIETSPSIPLEGSLNPHVRQSEDLGPLAPETPLAGVTLVFKRTPQQQADLEQLLAQQTDPSSPLYHHWLTPDDFASRFGVADADIDATQSWLQSHGFTIDSSLHARDRITFSGTAAQIQQAFGAELHRFRSNTDSGAELHFAPAAELSLPPALAPVTAAILHVSDFRPKPNVRTIHPDYTTASTQQHFLGPRDVAVMYDLMPLFNSSNYGSGQSIAIIGQSYVPTDTSSAIWHFQALLSQVDPIYPVLVPGSGVEAAFPLDEAESDIDLEYSSGIAQRSQIFFVYTGASGNYDVFDALSFAITQDIAPVISISYGACEPLLSAGDLQQFNSLFQQASAQGQTIVASAGDSGATACAGFNTTTAVQQQFAVGFPASSPYVTAVGGTQMASGTFTSGTSSYWTPASGTDNFQSLTSYVPEVVWNEDTASDGIFASTGGASSVFARPSWQTGVSGIPSGSYRLVPDIALQASASHPGYIVCSDDKTITGGSTSDCASGNATNSNGTYVLSGGTSFAAPIFAGYLAVLNQYKGSQGFGNVNPTLYSLAAQPSVYSSAFHDITSGTTACVSGVPDCGTAGQSAYAATTGYDMATGLGSLDFYNLANAWPTNNAAGLTPTWVAFSNSGDQFNGGTATAGQAFSFTIDVNSTVTSQGFVAPTGTVSVFLDGQLLNPSLAITAPTPTNSLALVNFSFTAPSSTGSHILFVKYPGDATHLPSTGALTILVGNAQPTGSVSISASNLSLSSNGTGTSQITISPSGGYTGQLTWSASLTGSVQQSVCYLVTSYPAGVSTTASMQIGVGTACSASPSASFVRSTVQTSSAHQPLKPTSRRTPAAATFVAILICGILPSSRRRRLLPMLCTALLATLSLSLTGCGGSGGTSITTGPQPATYTVTLKAQDSVNANITASTSFTLTVN